MTKPLSYASKVLRMVNHRDKRHRAAVELIEGPFVGYLVFVSVPGPLKRGTIVSVKPDEPGNVMNTWSMAPTVCLVKD